MAATDLTTLANVKQWLNLTATSDDALLTRLITAESNFIQAWLNRTIVQQTYAEVRDGGGAGKSLYEMLFANFPVTAVASLSINNIAIPASPDGGISQPGYGFDARRLWLAPVGRSGNGALNPYQFVRGQGNVVMTYTAGYATVPLDIEQACIELVSLRYKERERIGQNSKSLGGETVSFNVKAMTDSILESLQNYRKYFSV